MQETELGEGARGGDEVVEGPVVPQRYELVPQRFEAWYIAITNRLLDIGELRTAFQRVRPGIGHFMEQLGKIGRGFGVIGLAFEVDHRAAGGRAQRVREGLGLQPQLVHVVVERRGRDRKAHATQLGDDAIGAIEGLRAQPATQFRGFVHHWLEPQFHELVGGHQAGDSGADDRDFLAVTLRRNRAQACRMLQPVIEGEWKIRAENGDGFLAVVRVPVVLVH